MNMKNMGRSSILFTITILIATFIFSCTCSDTKTRDEIAQIEGQIKSIDQQIAQLIASKRSRSNTVIDDRRGINFKGRLIDQWLNAPIDKHNNEIDAEIYKLQSQREMLVVRFKFLYQSLNK